MHSWQPVNCCCCCIVCDNSCAENQQRLNLGPPAVYVCTGWCWQHSLGVMTNSPALWSVMQDWHMLTGGCYALGTHVKKHFCRQYVLSAGNIQGEHLIILSMLGHISPMIAPHISLLLALLSTGNLEELELSHWPCRCPGHWGQHKCTTRVSILEGSSLCIERNPK